MNTYILSFTGRKNGSIGVVYRIREIIEAKSLEEAKIKLYDHYEHISGVQEHEQ